MAEKTLANFVKFFADFGKKLKSYLLSADFLVMAISRERGGKRTVERNNSIA